MFAFAVAFQVHKPTAPHVQSANQTIVIAIRVQFVFAAPCAPTTRIQRRKHIDTVGVVMIQTTLPTIHVR